MNNLIELVKSWQEARKRVCAETTHDIRRSESYRDSLNALADAEAALGQYRLD